MSAEIVQSDELKLEASRLGFTTVGVAPAIPPPHYRAFQTWLDRGFSATMDYMVRNAVQRASPTSLLASAETVVAVTLNYNQMPSREPGKPKIARYALGRDYHRVLRSKLVKLGKWVQNRFPEAEIRACVDSAPILERDFAQLAGLGWFGKNTCLIDTKRGSWFFIGLLLTSVRFEIDVPAEGGCGTCDLCINACPTGAIVPQGGFWSVDSGRCISYLTIEHRGEFSTEQAAQVGDWTFGCDICQEVCPFNQPRDHQPLRATTTDEPGFLVQREWPNLEVLAKLEERTWDGLTQGSPARRTGLNGLTRNAKANLRNLRVSSND